MKIDSRRRRTAFTLVEVLAALTMAAVIIPVAMRAISVTTSTAGDTKKMMEAATLAEAKLAEICLDLESGVSVLEGEFEDDLQGYRWNVEIREWDGNSLKEVSVRVEWMSRQIARSVDLTTLVYLKGR